MKFYLRIIIFSFLIISYSLNAHPGNTAGDGCHYCRTNCSSWGEVYGARHCHSPKSYSTPSYTSNSYSSFNSTTSCPSNASYSYLKSTCICDDGYKVSFDKKSCVLDFSSNFNFCDSGSRWSSVLGKCVIDTDCPLNASYDFGLEGCFCNSGYQKSQDGGKCERIPNCPKNSEYSLSKRECLCEDGFNMNYQKTMCLKNMRKQIIENGLYNRKGNIECSRGYRRVWDKCVKNNAEPYRPRNIQNKDSRCPDGFSWYTYRRRCVKIPENAHAVNTPTDAWSCNDGYKEELGIRCVKYNVQCPANAFKFQDQCFCSPGHNYSLNVYGEMQCVKRYGID